MFPPPKLVFSTQFLVLLPQPRIGSVGRVTYTRRAVNASQGCSSGKLVLTAWRPQQVMFRLKTGMGRLKMGPIQQ